MKPPLTEPQARALDWLARNGGHAKPDRFGRMVATNGEICRIMPVVWLRLMLAGFCANSFLPGHIGITELGISQ